MTDKKEQTKAGATELSEKDLDQAQGGFKNSDGILQRDKKADQVFVNDAGADRAAN